MKDYMIAWDTIKEFLSDYEEDQSDDLIEAIDLMEEMVYRMADLEDR